MAKNKAPETDPSALRSRAKRRMTSVVKRDITAMSADDITKLIHELGTHQIELEMQNEELRRTHSELADVNQRYTELYDLAPIGYLTTDKMGKILQSNLTVAEMIGVKRADLVNQRLSNYILGPDQDVYYRHKSLLPDCSAGQRCEVRLLKSSGYEFWVRLDSLVVRNDDPEDWEIRSVLSDISDRKRDEQELQQSKKRLVQAQHIAHLGSWELDLVREGMTWSDEVYEILEETPGLCHASYSHFRNAIHPDDRELVKKAYATSVQYRRPLNIEHRLLMKDGRVKHVNSRCETIFDGNGMPLYSAGMILDITERKQAENRALQQAHYDTLTGLPNRFLSLDRLSQLLSEARRSGSSVALMFLDLDDFKKVNDSMGHEAGDKLLIAAAARLRSTVRSNDTVGRLGGDEFIILLQGLEDASDATPAANSLLRAFEKPFKMSNRDVIMTASIGIAVFPDDGDSTSEILRNADSAMYDAKRLGKNTYSYFTESMNLEILRRLSVEEQMRLAIERGEFEVLYQQQVEVSSGKIIGAEALLRWDNPQLGNVAPEEFIPIAEQTGLIVPIGKFVLNQALSITAQCRDEFTTSFRMAVNLSPSQLRDPELVHIVEAALQHTNVPAGNLELEITEGVLMKQHASIDNALSALTEMGVSIAMDDFGSGYSSLNYLRSYPFNVLKIDRSFVIDLATSNKSRALVKAAIAMAQALGLRVVAEGVQHEDQLAILRQAGCDYAQGFLFGKAVGATELLSA